MNNDKLKKSDLIKRYINAGYPKDEAVAEIDFAIDIICGLTPKDLIIGVMPSPKDINKINEIINQRLKTKTPMAYLLGCSYFMGKKFDVTPDTLIPRPETELLVKKATEIILDRNYRSVLDIGTGSGCIACMIAKKTHSQVLGVDISNEALKVALNNAMHHDLMNKAIFRKSDLFSKIREDEKFDIIVSNPPYIPLQDRTELQTEVKDYEPETALFTNDEYGLEFYEKISEKAPLYLNQGGFLLFETGYAQSKAVSNIMEKNGFIQIEVFKDVSGIERVVLGHLP